MRIAAGIRGRRLVAVSSATATCATATGATAVVWLNYSGAGLAACGMCVDGLPVCRLPLLPVKLLPFQNFGSLAVILFCSAGSVTKGRLCLRGPHLKISM